MINIFQVYLYICTIIVSIIILLALIAIVLNVICYCYQSIVGFDTFRKFLKKYNREMQIAKERSCKKCVNYKTNQCPNSYKCYNIENKPYFRKRGVLDAK